MVVIQTSWVRFLGYKIIAVPFRQVGMLFLSEEDVENVLVKTSLLFYKFLQNMICLAGDDRSPLLLVY